MKKLFILLILLILVLVYYSSFKRKRQKVDIKNYETIILASGCFWCVEAIYQRVKGVISVEVGYANGKGESKPSYKEVIGGNRGFAEVAKIIFDPAILSYEDLFKVFWKSHDPTTLNSQGNDKGIQYRSGIFYQFKEQKILAERSRLVAQRFYSDTIVTEIVPLENYFKAENYHQNYFNKNPDDVYCNFVIRSKLEKLGLKESKLNNK